MNKYRNKIVEHEGERFHSKRELARWLELKLLERAGAISNLGRQISLPLGEVRYESGRRAVLVVDFSYIENRKRVYEDTKGYETDVSRLKRAVLRSQGIEIRISK